VIGATLLFHLGVRVEDTTMFTFTSCLIAAYSAAVYSPHRVLAVTSLVVGAMLVAGFHETNIPDIAPSYVPFIVLIPIALAANAIHTQQQRARVLEAEQEAASRLAVDQERARIARELHDVVTHNVSVMVIQAGAARKVIDATPEQARQAMLAVEASGRAAMAELRHVMGLLTMTGDGTDPAADAELAPQPGLGQVAALASRISDTGVPVEVTTTGTPAPLPPGVDLAAFRVVQEALTNTVKHAAGARVQVTIDYLPDAVQVEVTDTGGTPTAAAGSGSGAGLIGLRERLAVYGGTLQAGQRPTSGYRVRAMIPVNET
jgi:signal transduction histidine kinase